MRMNWMPAFALSTALLGAGVANAQQNNTEPTRREAAAQRQGEERDGVRREGRRENQKDQMFATCLAIDNSAEIQISEFAAQRLQDEQAKQFAQQMISEHRALLEKLGQFGAEAVTLRNADNTPAAVSVQTGDGAKADVNVQVENRAGEERRADRREERADRRADSQSEFLAIKREIAEECVKSAQEELAAKPANEVDRCFMAAQVFGHQHMLTSLKVMERHASPEFKETLAQATQTTQQHLDHAKQILKTLDGQHQSNEAPATSGTNGR